MKIRKQCPYCGEDVYVCDEDVPSQDNIECTPDRCDSCDNDIHIRSDGEVYTREQCYDKHMQALARELSKA